MGWRAPLHVYDERSGRTCDVFSVEGRVRGRGDGARVASVDNTCRQRECKELSASHQSGDKC